MKKGIFFALATAALLAGCSSSPTGSTTQGQGSSAAGTDLTISGGVVAEARVLFRTDAGWEPYTSPFGDTTMEYTRRYDVKVLYPNGFAFVGYNTNDIDDVVCDAPKQDKGKHDICVAYKVDGATIQLGEKTTDFAVNADKVTIDGIEWRVLAPNAPIGGTLALTGYFGTQAAVDARDARIGGAKLQLAGNGTFVASKGESSYALIELDYWRECARKACTVTGTYTVREHSIVFEATGFESRTLFLRSAAPDDIQIGSEWYETK